MAAKLTLKDIAGRDIFKEAGFDRLPMDIIDKRVTDLLNLKGRKAVVTGAGATGLGRACANRLAGLGADVALVDLDGAGAKRNAEEVEKKWGTKAYGFKGDATNWDDVRRFLRECHEKLGGIDILVNNVGGSGGPRRFVEQKQEQIDATIARTLVSTVYVSHAVLDYMIPQRSGRIINISSGAADAASPLVSVYGACKAGVSNLTKTLSAELADYGIQVMGVAPGYMVNEYIVDRLRNPTEDNIGQWEVTVGVAEKSHRRRASLPEEVANVVAFLASDAASYIAGTTVNVVGMS